MRLLLMFTILLVMAESRIALAQDVTAAKVREAINSGVNYLKGSQNKQTGEWRKQQMFGDTTALATLALLNAGVSPLSPMSLEEHQRQPSLPHKAPRLRTGCWKHLQIPICPYTRSTSHQCASLL